MIHIDFETRSRAEIYESGAWVYSQDPSTEILCLAYCINDGPVEILTREAFLQSKEDIFIDLAELFSEIEEGHLFAAYNAFFEECIWANIMVPKFGAPPIPIKRWRCVMAKALARSLPRALGDCGKALKAPVTKDEEGRRVMLKVSKPNKDGNWNESPEDLEKLYTYCINDVEAERAIDKMIPDLIPPEQNIWFLDQLINRRGIHVDIKAVEKSLKFIDLHTKILNQTVFDVSEGKLEGVSRRMAVLEWCKSQGVDIKGYTKRDVADTLCKVLPDRVRAVLETRVALGKTSVKKYAAIQQSTSSDGRIRDLFLYHGANTGRWAGKLIQIHNLPKGNIADTDEAVTILKNSSYKDFSIFYPDVMSTLSSCIRGMIISSPGHDLLVADYNAIEARILLWLADEEYGLNQFRKGVDLYVEMARVIYNRGKITKNERQLGKAAVLGCGYGMGPDKFFRTCNDWGIPVSQEVANKAVSSYREIYSRVPSSWFNQEAAAIRCVETKEDQIFGRIRWEIDGTDLLCRLPSGRCIVYNDASLKYIETPWGQKKLALHYMGLRKVQGKTTTKWDLVSTYGGKLVENITQAVARDILAAAMFRSEKNGYRVAFSVHDEIVAEVKEGVGSINEFESILCALPKWAVGCPITAHGFRTKRYRKD